MARIDKLISDGLKSLPPKPPDKAKQKPKRRYSELVSQKVALAIATELRARGLDEIRPVDAKDAGPSGAERRMGGGLGAKKVDVTWATEASGLLLAISIKTINFRDQRSQNFQKNLTNRRGDMLMESMTLHRRFPYSVIAGFFFLDKEAATDNTESRRSTFLNAHARLQLFTGRSDPAGRDEQFERFYLILLGASPKRVSVRPFLVGKPDVELKFEHIIQDLLQLVAQRNPDFYEYLDGNLRDIS